MNFVTPKPTKGFSSPLPAFAVPAGIIEPTGQPVTKSASLAPYFVPYLIAGLALMGIADAFYVAHASYYGQLLREIIIEGANTVLTSPYARIFGMPLSYFGFIYYSYMLALAVLLAFDPFSRGLRAGTLVYAAIGVCSSLYFMYIQFNYIHAVCVYCLFSAVTTLLLLILASWHFQATRALRAS
jgi:uncharacterized membrane protein